MFDEIKIQTFKPGEALPDDVILPQQTHSANIVEFETGLENFANTDGLWTKRKDLLLGVKTADCAPICVWNKFQFGIVHAGWRGTVNGVIENLLLEFETGLQTNQKHRDRSLTFNTWIGPILPRFEIQKNDCYHCIEQKFGPQFFTNKDQKLYFEFKACLKFMLPNAQFDPRSTYEDQTLSSWRRDKHFENGQNVTVIGPKHLF